MLAYLNDDYVGYPSLSTCSASVSAGVAFGFMSLMPIANIILFIRPVCSNLFCGYQVS